MGSAFCLLPSLASCNRKYKFFCKFLDEMCRKAGSGLEELIVEIIVGPESTQSLPILRDYLEDLSLPNLSKRIFLSDCPLRSKM